MTRDRSAPATDRGVAALRAVLPPATKVRAKGKSEDGCLTINATPITVEWAGEGWLRDLRPILSRRRGRPDVVAARRMSPGAREALSAAGVGWVDETGAAEIAVDSIVISRTGTPQPAPPRPARWTPAVLAVAEALLCGTRATVSSTHEATGLSVGACTKALRLLTDLGLLEAEAKRGRDSARQVADEQELLTAYASAVESLPAPVRLELGVAWQDPLAGVASIGQQWDRHDRSWAATGTVAAAVLAPYLTSVTGAEIYVDAGTVAELAAAAAEVGLRPIEGGRLTLRPFPAESTRRLRQEVDGITVAPWPRVYADLRPSGVRGEEAAEHLREVMLGR